MLLVLDEKYSHIRILIDAATLSYQGNTREYTDAKADSSLFFRLADDSQAHRVFMELTQALTYTVVKSEYIRLRTEFEDYETDKRPRFFVRLPSGYKGIGDPSAFRLVPVTDAL